VSKVVAVRLPNTDRSLVGKPAAGTGGRHGIESGMRRHALGVKGDLVPGDPFRLTQVVDTVDFVTADHLVDPDGLSASITVRLRNRRDPRSKRASSGSAPDDEPTPTK
jgi:hypothetical protein